MSRDLVVVRSSFLYLDTSLLVCLSCQSAWRIPASRSTCLSFFLSRDWVDTQSAFMDGVLENGATFAFSTLLSMADDGWMDGWMDDIACAVVMIDEVPR